MPDAPGLIAGPLLAKWRPTCFEHLSNFNTFLFPLANMLSEAQRCYSLVPNVGSSRESHSTAGLRWLNVAMFVPV